MSTSPEFLETERQPTGWSARVVIGTALGYFEGHFPGAPILPGVALLVLVERFLQQVLRGPVAIVGVAHWKLRSRVDPGAQLRISVDGTDDPTSWRFRIDATDGAIVCSGTARLER